MAGCCQAGKSKDDLHGEIDGDGRQCRNRIVLRLQKAVLDGKGDGRNRHESNAHAVLGFKVMRILMCGR